MKTVCLICFSSSVLVTSLLSGQRVGWYSSFDVKDAALRINISESIVNLYLLQNGSYFLDLDIGEGTDIHEEYELSYGKYYSKGNNLTLVDALNDYRFTLKIGRKYLIFNESFNCFANKALSFSGPITGSPKIDISFKNPNLKSSNVIALREKYIKENKSLFPFMPGNYNITSYYLMHIDANKTYYISIQGAVISQGTWKREANELILRDNGLKHNFRISATIS